jgi:3-oxoacyl-[acyl-carrier protein] reductase
MGTAEEVADLVAYLVSDRAAYITGAVLQIDGGITI